MIALIYKKNKFFIIKLVKKLKWWTKKSLIIERRNLKIIRLIEYIGFRNQVYLYIIDNN
jgi:hypothetical protein